MTVPAHLSLTLYQGTTQRIPLQRQYVAYAVKGDECKGFTNACTGAAVPPADFVDEDYTGCQARMQIRPAVNAARVLLELTTDNGGITLAGKTLTLVFHPVSLQGISFDEAIGHVEVVRPNGDVERQYELTFTLSPEGTR